MSVMDGLSGMLRAPDGYQALIFKPVLVPTELETHEVNFSPGELEFLQLEGDALNCTCCQEVVHVPKCLLDAAVAQKRVINTFVLPCVSLGGIIEPFCIVIHQGPTVLEPSPRHDERYEASALLVELHLVAAPVCICQGLQGVFGDAKHHIKGR